MQFIQVVKIKYRFNRADNAHCGRSKNAQNGTPLPGILFQCKIRSHTKDETSNIFLHFPKWRKSNKIDYFTHEIWAETRKEKKNKT